LDTESPTNYLEVALKTAAGLCVPNSLHAENIRGAQVVKGLDQSQLAGRHCLARAGSS